MMTNLFPYREADGDQVHTMTELAQYLERIRKRFLKGHVLVTTCVSAKVGPIKLDRDSFLKGFQLSKTNPQKISSLRVT